MSTDRILVNAAIAPTFIPALKAALAAKSSSGDLPPTLVSSASKARVQALISGALSSGANIIHGTFDESKGAEQETSVRMAPIFLGDAKEDMQVWQDESFASLAACMIVKDDDEAVRIANTGGYGLSAAVFTEDLRKGLALAKRIESG